MIAEPDWIDLATAYTRMKARRLLTPGKAPAEVAGHILTIATMAHAQQRGSRWHGIAQLIDEYARWKQLSRVLLAARIEDYWKSCGQWPRSAETILEELSKE